MTYSAEKYSEDRTCDTCTECCMGYLTGQIHEYQMAINNPCHFLDLCEKNCSIYDHRPQLCKDYRCAWLDQKVLIPNWMKPEYSKVIITQRQSKLDDVRTIDYWSVTECGQTMSSEVLNWIFNTCKIMQINLTYKLNGADYHIGSDEFMQFIKDRRGNIFV